LAEPLGRFPLFHGILFSIRHGPRFVASV